MEFLCKFCGKRESEPQGWLIAFELTHPGSDLRNTLVYLDEWDEKNARRSNALHFCSKACQQNYLAHWEEKLAA